MEFDELYVMSDALMHGALHLCPRNDIADPFAFLRAETLPSVPVVLEYSSGGKPRDAIGTEVIGVVAYSGRVIQILRDGGVTGWATYPLDIHGKSGEKIEGYHGFAVTGRCGPIDNARSSLEPRPPRVPGGPNVQRWIGLYFAPETWDGSDIFMPEDWGCVFVVEPVKKALEKAKVKNFEFTRLTEFERLQL